MRARSATLWVEIVLALALITLATILLNAGVFWLLSVRGELERHTDLTLTAARTLRAQLEAPVSDRDKAWKRALQGYRKGQLEVHTLWVTDAQGRTIAKVAGEPPTTPDDGLRQALYGRDEHVQSTGGAMQGKVVMVTEPLVVGGAVAGALRIGLPWSGVGPARSGVGFAVLYTLFSGTLIGVFGYALFRRRLISPVQQIQEATTRIASGDFGSEVRVDSARELEELCAALTAMSMSLQAYRRRTAEQVNSLESANQELLRMQDELIRSEKLASVGRLAAGIAHEVGNPLTAVLGYTELLTEEDIDDALEADLLLRTRTEVERIHRIIRELLDYARPGEGEATQVSVPLLAEEAARTVQLQPAVRGVRILTEMEEGLPLVRGEPDKLHQVLVNLLLNAADAMEGDGRVTLAGWTEEGVVCVSCRDTGPGFPEADLPKVFEPFFTSKEPGRGTGLGLATCLRVVEQQGGWIRAENHPEGGAVVVMGLPVA